MKLKIVIFTLLLTILSCKKEEKLASSSAEKSIEQTLKNFPMIDKKLIKVKEVNLDSLSISLYRNSKIEPYDEILIFEKNKRFYAIPFFSNMYFDFWNFKNENQKQLYPKTNTTFEIQIKKIITDLNLKPGEFDLLIQELVKSILNSESNLELKPKIFENYVYSTFKVDKYKIEEVDSCLNRSKKVYNHILNESKKTIRYNQFYLDNENGRVYEFINESHKKGENKFIINVYRIDCFSYRLNI